jgi:signal transduction histidine kinase
VRRDRAIAIHASHELRTPLTALRLSLEDLTLWKQTPPDVANELTQAIRDLDRLADAVTEILEQHHDNRPIERVDVAAVVSATVARWRPRVADTHEITLDARGPLVAELPPDQVDEVLDAMMGHAATRCSETIAVDVRRHRSTIRVRVSYPGTRCPATGVIHATANEVDTDGNPDLAESGGLAESMGAYLTMEEEPDGTCLVLTIPAAGVWTPSLI